MADCLAKFKVLRAAGGQETGGMDNHGNPVSIVNATAMSYALCIQTCGTGPIFRAWSIFSQRFSTWLLPFLALVCQLPFGANNRVSSQVEYSGEIIHIQSWYQLDNIVSMLLHVGSPTLGAYSVILTLLNTYWIRRRFSHISYPNAHNAMRILNALQQAALKVNTEDALLASLVVLPENNFWWSELIVWLDMNYAHTWSFANVASIGWVVVAFSLTVIDVFKDVTNNSTPPLNSNGLAVAFAWLWLLPIVTSWLQTGPRSDRSSLHRAVAHANELAYMATEIGAPVPAGILFNQRAICIARRHNHVGADEHRTAPVYNYARIFCWTAAVEAVYSAFNEATLRAENCTPVNPNFVWVHDRDGKIKDENRRGSLKHIAFYVGGDPGDEKRWVPGSVIFRILVSSAFALLLTWGTISGAMLLQFFTPTIGLSCRSGSYLLYACVSTLVWVLLILSSFLSSVPWHTDSSRSRTSPLAGRAAVLLRRSGKILAGMNATWIVLTCLFQFTGIYDSCWCTSSHLYLGARAYSVLILTPADIAALWYPVVGATLLASGVVIAFITFINVLREPEIPSPT
ncbi:hypothetical protein B0H17DRAFT_1337114 [Mycena rosella]|uniref:Uncharacterized protein n=1 Tax=Mycena rosella TaxID=1033263 RepID=A0AAD7CTV1_MYCRO|nr:hypothetical protein B0H17DRAFT_1337114 [Mycena rosella]